MRARRGAPAPAAMSRAGHAEELPCRKRRVQPYGSASPGMSAAALGGEQAFWAPFAHFRLTKSSQVVFWDFGPTIGSIRVEHVLHVGHKGVVSGIISKNA